MHTDHLQVPADVRSSAPTGKTSPATYNRIQRDAVSDGVALHTVAYRRNYPEKLVTYHARVAGERILAVINMQVRAANSRSPSSQKYLPW
jgi:hypothetical protein